MKLQPLLLLLSLGFAQAAQLTVLASPDPTQLRVRVNEDDAFTERPEIPSDPLVVNVLRNLARLLPEALSHLPVTCRPERGPSVQVFTDFLGYDVCRFPTADTGQVTVLIEGAPPAQVTPLALGNAARITVTDLDDTVIVTGVVQGQALRNVLTANGTNRPLFPDAPALLRAQAGRGPVVYLSNSPDGLTPSLQTLLRVHHLTEGPLSPMPETLALRGRLTLGEVIDPFPLTESGRIDRNAGPWHLPLVGRSDELRRLRELWAAASRGRGPAAWLSGEAGVGKTRLARKLALRAPWCWWAAPPRRRPARIRRSPTRWAEHCRCSWM